MAKLTNLCACIAILALMSSTLAMAHVVKPPPKAVRLRKLQMDMNIEEHEPETNRILASNLAHKATEHHHHSEMDKAQASASGCGGGGGGGGVYGEGHGSGGTSLGFHNLFPFPSFPFGVVPEVTTWGEGGGSGGSNTNPGMGGVGCQCCNNGYTMHYVISPVHFQPMNSFSTNRMRKDGPIDDMATSPSGNN